MPPCIDGTNFEKQIVSCENNKNALPRHDLLRSAPASCNGSCRVTRCGVIGAAFGPQVGRDRSRERGGRKLGNLRGGVVKLDRLCLQGWVSKNKMGVVQFRENTYILGIRMIYCYVGAMQPNVQINVLYTSKCKYSVDTPQKRRGRLGQDE